MNGDRKAVGRDVRPARVRRPGVGASPRYLPSIRPMHKLPICDVLFLVQLSFLEIGNGILRDRTNRAKALAAPMRWPRSDPKGPFVARVRPPRRYYTRGLYCIAKNIISVRKSHYQVGHCLLGRLANKIDGMGGLQADFYVLVLERFLQSARWAAVNKMPRHLWYRSVSLWSFSGTLLFIPALAIGGVGFTGPSTRTRLSRATRPELVDSVLVLDNRRAVDESKVLRTKCRFRNSIPG